MKKQFLFSAIFIVFLSQFMAQNKTMDSLKFALKTAKHDTTRCNILNAMIEAENDETVWPKYNEQLLQIAEAALKTLPNNTPEYRCYKKHYSSTLNNLGVISRKKGNIPKAFECYNKCLKLNEELGDKKGIALALSNIGFIYNQQGDLSQAMDYYKQSLKMRETIGDKDGVASSLTNIGFVYNQQGNVPRAMDYFIRSLKLREALGDKDGIAVTLINMGYIYRNQGNIPKALEYYSKCLKIQEELNDKSEIATLLSHIGSIYYDLGDVSKALEYHGRSLKIREELGNSREIANSLISLGKIYYNQGDTSVKSSKKDALRAGQLKALDYYTKSLDIHEKIGDKKGIAISLSSLATVYETEGDIAKALDYLERSLKIREEIEDKSGVAGSLNNIGRIYLNEKKYSEALKFCSRSMTISKELGFPESIKNAANALYKIYSATGKPQLALDNYEIYIQMRDSIVNEESKKVSLKNQFKYEYEKKALADSLKVAEDKRIATAQLKQEKTKRYALYGGLTLVALFGMFMLNRFRVTQKQKNIIELKEKETQQQNEIIKIQKHLVEEKHKEITDSINYAERIQRSFLATEKQLSENLNNYFVLFKPKDVVSGDFYWSAKLSNGTFALATADSTGHGVPGAIMSLLNVTSLEKAIEHYTNPADILNHTRQTIIERLKKDGSEEGGKDGMDCSLLAFDFANKQLYIAAANSPVWIIRNNEIIEIKPDKMPVGKSDKQDQPFTTQTLELQKDDTIYTLTDGFPDQFGGDKGKKFMSKKLKELLLANVHLSIAQQKELLESTFKSWVGDFEQVDDVTVIGIKV